MNPVKFAVAAAFACGAAAMAPSAASAMPIANVDLAPAPQIEDVAAVRVCNAYGHCWWRATGPYYGYRRPYYGAYRYGWRRPYGYHYGWRHPHYRHYGYGWRGGHGGGWHHGFGGRGHWR